VPALVLAFELGLGDAFCASIKPDEVQQLKAKGLGASEIARTLGIGRASVYRALGDA
jgi:DNA invertase Pin-like site-specific DNA recombinase